MNNEDFKPMDAFKSPRFTQIATFSRLKYTQSLDNTDVCFLGIPFDSGTTYRTGARQGPSAIREQSRLLRSYNYFMDVYPYDHLNVIDNGDVDVVPVDIMDTFKAVEDRIESILSKNVVPVIAGGDHSITYPILKQMKKKHGILNILHLDSHFDFWDQYWGKKYTHGTWLKRAMDEGLLKNISQGGMRGGFFDKMDLEFIKDHNINFQSIREFHELGTKEVMRSLLKSFDPNDPLYVSIDIDVVDPAFAGGTGTPEVGGITSWDALECIRSLVGYRIVGLDIVEVSPIFDPPSQNTALLAANLLFEAICVIAKNKNNGNKLY